MWELDKIQ